MIYNDYNTYLKTKYGEKIYKLPINLPVTCPNRDGTKGYGGCTFCAEAGAGFESLDNMIPVKTQLSRNREYMGKKYHAKKFIAYLQNYTNTYLPPQAFQKVMEDCVGNDIVAISVSTRPDCVGDEYLEIAYDIAKKTGTDIIFELGLQTVNDQTLKIINRGHTLNDYINAVKRIKSYDFAVGTHLIPNLPYDTKTDIINAAKLLSDLGTDTVKLHNLFLIEKTPMAQDYKNHKFEICTYEEYFERIALFLQHISTQIAIERFFARCPEEGCVFSNWGRSWRWLQNELITYLFQNNIKQGVLYEH
ncbi:MAG: TIGR01212 family radical SAM protein [Clostridiales bacterium]|nr:MAG: TIGR01212 family radical SAM protein [Clostridiales bacterium]